MSEGYLKDVTILLVEDNGFDRRLLTNVLRAFGARNISVARDGAEAWEIFKKNPTDLVLTDWMMKPVDGVALTRKLRDRDESPDAFVPIIMVTASSTQAAIFQARDSGVNEIAVKPLVPQALLSRIVAVIDRPRPYVKAGEFFGPDRRRRDAPFHGEDRRGRKVEKAAPAPEDLDRTLDQDEINNVMSSGDPEAA